MKQYHSVGEILPQFNYDKKKACEMDIDLTVDSQIITFFMGQGKEIKYEFGINSRVKRQEYVVYD